MDSLVRETWVEVAAYKSVFLIMSLNVRRQSQTLKTEVMDVQVKLDFNEAVPASTAAYSVIISDRFY